MGRARLYAPAPTERPGTARDTVPAATGRRILGWLTAVALGLLVLGWFAVLRPAVLGGPASYILVAGTSMEPTLQPGSLVIAERQASYAIGQVVAYRIPDEPGKGLNVIHRIVGGSAEQGFILRGDNVPASDLWRPKGGDILGTAEVVLPGAESAIRVLRSPILVASVAAGLATFLVLGFWPTKTREESTAG
jgi:signal peptidase